MPQAQTPDPTAPSGGRPTLPLGRLFLLTFVTAAFALIAQALLALTDAPASGLLIRVIVPLGAAALLFVGLRPYPAAGRARLAVMVAVALLLVGLNL